MLPSKSLLLLAVLATCLLLTTQAIDIVTPDYTALTFPAGVSEQVLDVYTNSSAGIFLALTDSSVIYSLDSTHENILSSVNIGSLESGRIYYDLAQSSGFVYVLGENPFAIWRFSIYNVSDNPVSFAVNTSYNFQLAIDPTTNYGYVAFEEKTNGQVVDLITMTQVVQFQYAYFFADYPASGDREPGGYALALDSNRKLLYVGVDCWTPTPAYVWQLDISNVQNITLANRVIYSAGACFEEGFVETSDGRAWFYEDDAGWNGAFDPSDLNFGMYWTVPTSDYVEAFEYVSTDHMTFWLDAGDGNTYRGRLYRACNLETMPGGVHEIVTWAGPNDYNNVCGSHWDSPSRTLYVVSCSGNVTTFAVAATDCQQVPTDYQCSPASSLAPFSWLYWFRN